MPKSFPGPVPPVFSPVCPWMAPLCSRTKKKKKLYGKPLTTKEIVQGTVKAPPGARVLISALEKYAPHRQTAHAKRASRNECLRLGQCSSYDNAVHTLAHCPESCVTLAGKS